MNSSSGRSTTGRDGTAPIKPDPAMKLFLYLIGLVTPVFCTFPWTIPVALLSIPPGFYRLLFVFLAHLPFAVTVALVLWWVPKYYDSITYLITDDWLITEGGVIWQRRARLPIDRVQLVDVMQGPLQRRYGLASVNVQTAAVGEARAELSLVNVKNADRVREDLLARVSRHRADHTGLVSAPKPPGENLLRETAPPETLSPRTRGEPAPDRLPDQLLVELRAIRRLLEQSQKANQFRKTGDPSKSGTARDPSRDRS